MLGGIEPNLQCLVFIVLTMMGFCIPHPSKGCCAAHLLAFERFKKHSLTESGICDFHGRLVVVNRSLLRERNNVVVASWSSSIFGISLS